MEQLSPRLLELITNGLKDPGDNGQDTQMPQWFDKKLFDLGRNFFRKYFFSIIFAQFLGLMTGFGVNRLLVPLIFTRKSDTPKKALSRYLSTTMHVMTWFEHEVWDPNKKGFKDIANIRKIHKIIDKQLNQKQNIDSPNNVEIKNDNFKPDIYLYKYIRSDISCKSNQVLELEGPETRLNSQYDMVMTQFSFVAFVILHPHKVGIWWCSDEEVLGFIHCWRTIGWLLGIEDKHNLCRGTVDEVRAICLEIETRIIIPHMSRVGPNYEHMCQALCQGIRRLVHSVTFERNLLFISDIIGIHIAKTKKCFSWYTYLYYWFMKFVVEILFRVPYIPNILNVVLHSALTRASGIEHKWWLL